MILTKSLLNEIVKEELVNSQGLNTVFQKGDEIKDINPDCPHFGSQGIVIKVSKDEVTYNVTNNGKTYQDGDELTKTKDQVVKLNSDEIEEDFAMGSRKDRVAKTKKTAEVLGHTMVGEVDEPTWDLTKNKDRGDTMGESTILTEIRVKYIIHNIQDSRLKNLLLKAINKLSGGKVIELPFDRDKSIALEIDSKYMDVLGDFIKKYDKSRSVKIIDQFKKVVYDGKRGINKLGEDKLGRFNESTVRIAQMKDAIFTSGMVQLLGKQGKVGLDRKSVSALVKLVRSGMKGTGMGRSFTAHEGKLSEGSTHRLPNGIQVTIDFKGITLQGKGKPVFLDRREMMVFFKATARYLK